MSVDVSSRNGGEAVKASAQSRIAREARRTVDKVLEYAKFESASCKALIGCSGLAVATLLRAAGRRGKALQVETSLHRNAFFAPVDRIVERRVQRSLGAGRAGKLERYIETLTPQPSTEVFFQDPARLLGSRIIVIKSASAEQKGALILDYSFVFSLFARLFDIDRIAERYHIVLEPSWSGSCDRDVLALAGERFPLFVQSHEPRDIEFAERFGANLIPVPISANWWVDQRVFRPLPGASKDADVLMNAAWAKFKRHDAFFTALAKLRARGERLRVLLVGYRMDMTRDQVFQLAQEHGVADQLEMFERLSPDEVNRLLNRAKVNLVWSRREGSNRAVIEGFAAGTPGILRAGFNYGHEYPFMNAATGQYATDRNLAERLLEMTRAYESYHPRAWVEQHMSPRVATDIVDGAIARYAARAGEKWTTGQLAVKVTSLDSMKYRDETERARFDADYAFLHSMLRARD